MRKFTSRILCAIITVCLVFSFLPIVTIADSNDIYVDSWNASLRDNIAVNFLLHIPANEVDGVDFVAEVDGELYIIESEDFSPVDTLYKATVNIAPAQMTEDISVSLKNDGVVVHEAVYTLRGYVDHIVQSDECSVADKEMAIALLQYGAACQRFFEYNLDKMADSGYEEYFVEGSVPSYVSDMEWEGRINGVSFVGASLLFKDSIAVRYYFRVANSFAIGGISCSVDGVGCEISTKDDMYYIDAPVSNPQELSSQMEASISLGDSVICIRYSPMNYIKRMVEKGDEEIATLCKALCAYWEASNLYVQSSSAVDEVFVSGITDYPGLPSYADDTITEIYFVAAENDIEVGTEFESVFSHNLCNESDSGWVNIGMGVTITKETPTIYAIRGAEIAEQDHLKLGGEFYNVEENRYLIIPTIYLYINIYGVGRVQTSGTFINKSEIYVIEEINITDNDGMTITFDTGANNAPFSESFEAFYFPNSGVATLTRGGVTSVYESFDLGVYKLTETSYWMSVSYSEAMQSGDVLTLNGNFVYGEIILHFKNVSITFQNS